MLASPAPTWRQYLAPPAPASNIGSNESNGRNGRNAVRPPLQRAATLILPRLYLSDFYTARDEKALANLGITHVISVIEHVPTLPELIPEDEEHRLHVSIADRSDEDILTHLDTTTEFIRRALGESKSNKVLVRQVCCIYMCMSLRPKYAYACTGALLSRHKPQRIRRLRLRDRHSQFRDDIRGGTHVRPSETGDRLSESRVPDTAGEVRDSVRRAAAVSGEERELAKAED
jgi:hypothetical protein